MTTTNRASSTPNGALLASALEYAARNWHLFPLIPGGKRPAAPRHPEHECDRRTDWWCRNGHTGWQQRATTDQGRITRAWSSRPYGIGIATGPSGLLVIDTDTPKPGARTPAEWTGRATSGEDVLSALVADHEPLPDTWTVRTPSGGIHRYYTRPDGIELGNTAGRLGWLIDTRATGGYVVAPPTRTNTGVYDVVSYAAPAPLPGWLTDLLTGPTMPDPGSRTARTVPADLDRVTGYVRAAVEGETARVREATEGTRNHSLFIAAVALGQLVGGGALTEHTATNALLDAAAGHVTARAFTDAEALATVRSGLRRGARTPRTITARRAA
ncbi:bifunctional DNA primase/polymerase [Antribacter sp. KLBMP9083]|uniref:Bifunctional DNA primase/polymerase n=1 Tax=Antribacter soli TaxID=2910976 RepID=A0AA41QFI6_9MICO|nr:bifunctional DNA primase/polymerase [Antribacter soli]MCF4122186.1 bifunctional DNA primase/polymerase [Antribacter soli]